MDERPVRLTVADDLRRGHGSAFFRFWFALPFLLWLAIWAIAAFFVAIANWAVTLIRGRSPDSLHNFLARFVRYATHTYAYVNLGSEPLPNFDGKPGYAIDVAIDPPREQNRWGVAFRVVLAVPAFMLVGVIAGGVETLGRLGEEAQVGGPFGLIGAAGFLGWFFAVARGRMPQGLRDLIAYGLSYAAQAWAYILLVTDRYPSSDPLTSTPSLAERDDPIHLHVRDDLRRSRLTVFFRFPLAIPHLVWLSLWALLAFFAIVVNWFATLINGTSPERLHRFLAAYVRYQTHVGAFLMLIGNPFPGFVGAPGVYPVDPHIADRARQNRWHVFFRLFLAIPTFILASAYATLLFTIAILGWFASLATGKMPVGMRNAGALSLRYMAQANGYLFLLTGAYPYSGPCIEHPSAPLQAGVAAPVATY